MDKANSLVGGDDAFLIIDDTALPKKGDHSVGVSHQYCGALGKQANCQSLVSVTLARGDVPVPIALRLHLPEKWATDAARREKAGIPLEVVLKEKWKNALDEIARIQSSGVVFGAVLADAGYGACAAFRHGLTSMDLIWAVGILPTQLVYPLNARARITRRSGAGPRPKIAVASHARRDVVDVIQRLGEEAWVRLSWRDGTKGPLEAEFSTANASGRRTRRPGSNSSTRRGVLAGR